MRPLLAILAVGLLAPAAAPAAVTLGIVDSETPAVPDAVAATDYATVGLVDLDGDGVEDVLAAGGGRPASRAFTRPIDGRANLETLTTGVPGADEPSTTTTRFDSAVVDGGRYLLAASPGSALLLEARRGLVRFRAEAFFADDLVDAALGDATGDGLVDVATLRTNGQLALLVGVLDNGLVRLPNPAVPIGTVSGTPIEVRIGDLAGSPVADVVAASAGASPRLAIATSTGGGTFTPLAQTTGPAAMTDLELGDLDGDGRTDAAVSSGTNVTIVRNESGQGGPVFGALSSRANGAGNLAVADVDGDGTSEIVTDAQGGLAVRLFDVVAGAPQAPQSFDTYNGFGSVAAADLDGDGADEIVTGARGVDVLANVSPGAATATPASLDLGAVETGRTGEPVSFTITNDREGPERVRAIRVEGAAAFDVLATDACATPLPPGGTCTVTARLAPSVTGARSAQIRVDLQHAADLVVPVAGNGAAPAPAATGPTGAKGVAGPAGPVGPAGPAGASATPRRAPVLATSACARDRRTRTRVTCSLTLAAGADLASRVRLLLGTRAVRSATLRAGGRSVRLVGTVPTSRRSVVLELRPDGFAAQRRTVRITAPRR